MLFLPLFVLGTLNESIIMKTIHTYLLSIPPCLCKPRRIAPNNSNLIKVADDFFSLGDPFKSRMILSYLARSNHSFQDLDYFLDYLSRLCRPYGVVFARADYLARSYHMPKGTKYITGGQYHVCK